jgi:hypothetical protein
MNKTSFLFFISLVFVSCAKENTDKHLIIENTKIPLISKVLIGDEIYMDYSYNDANLVTEEKSKFHYSRHTYNENNQLITSDYYWDEHIASSNSSVLEEAMNRKEWVNPGNTPKTISHMLEYNSKEHLVKISFLRSAGGGGDMMEYRYEGDMPVRATSYYNGLISNYRDYFYDDKGNMTREERYNVSSAGAAVLSTTTEYEYDEMHNPWQSFRRLLTPGIYTNPNNITKETYTLHFEVDPWIENIQVTEYSYEYNEKGYPVRVNGLTQYVYK